VKRDLAIQAVKYTYLTQYLLSEHMKITIPFAIIIILSLTGTSEAQQKSLLDEKSGYLAESEAKMKMVSAQPNNSAMIIDQNIDVHHYNLELEIEPETGHITGVTTIYFSLEMITDDIVLNLSDVMSVSAVTSSTAGEIIFSRIEGDNLLIQPVGGFSSGYHFVTVAYQGVPPTTGLGSFVATEVRGNPSVWTLSQPYGASDWFVCKNDVADKADSVDVKVIMPKPFVVASNGLLVDKQDLVFDRTLYHWKSTYPIAHYLISIAAAHYTVLDDWYIAEGGDSLLVSNFIYPDENMDVIRPQLDQLNGMLDLFTELFGPYPFNDEKYGHAQFGSIGGMEHQTISSMNNFGFFLMAHELAHQWFGDAVTVDSWNDLWMHEGFATLSEALTLERFIGVEDYRSWLRVRRNLIVNDPGGSIYLSDEVLADRDFSRIFSSRLTYRKAAWVLHMLRNEIGDEAFFEGIREFLRTPRLYGVSNSYEFRYIMEQEHGSTLETFFDQWVYGEGHPRLAVNFRSVSGDVSSIAVDISQSGSHPSVPIFNSPLDIRFSSADRDTIYTVRLTEANHTFILSPNFNWSNIEVDPHANLLYTNMLPTSNTNIETPAYPTQFMLGDGYPNPFNPTTFVPITINQQGTLILDVIDIQGRQLAVIYEGVAAIGRQNYLFDARNIASGVLFIRARMGLEQQIMKMTLIR